MVTDARVVVITGVTGSGKTTVGRALAQAVGWPFHDADDLHTPEHVARMRQGLPLDDEMRQPWLLRVRAVIEQAISTRDGAIVACSALRHQYRDVLAGGLAGVHFVLLSAPAGVLRRRLAERTGHFAGPALLQTQLEILEPPRDALTVDATLDVPTIVETIRSALHLGARDRE